MRKRSPPAGPPWEMPPEDEESEAAQLPRQAERGPTIGEVMAASIVSAGVGLSVFLMNRYGVRIWFDNVLAPAPAATPPSPPASRRRGRRGRGETGTRGGRVRVDATMPASRPPAPPPRPAALSPAESDEAAAALLGVQLDATEADINAAYKRVVRQRLGAGGFGDQGGDPEDTATINAAKARMKERARRRAARSGT